MSYLQFLAAFLGIPILILGLALKSRIRLRHALSIGLFSLVALVYTTPWDNYLVATGVWSYDPALVLGITLGWVPLEEYLFFILQPVLIGLWFLALRSGPGAGELTSQDRPQLRWVVATSLCMLWLFALSAFLAGWLPTRYLTLELIWAIPPILLQLMFGVDLLLQDRWRVSLAVISGTLYLAAADALAIRAGTWTINPDQSLGVYLGGTLPLEELVFFLLTNILIVFGMSLILNPQSNHRMVAYLKTLRRVRQTHREWPEHEIQSADAKPQS